MDNLRWSTEAETLIAPIAYTSLAIIIATVFVYFYKPHWALRKVPGPPTTPLLGHLLLFAKHGPDIIPTLAKLYGPIFRFHIGRQPLVIIADPDLCKEVGIKKFKDIPNRSVPTPIESSTLQQKGLIFSRDARWATMRNAVVSLYQPTHLASQLPVMKSVIDSLTANLLDSENKDINFSDLTLKMATDTIGQSAFGVDFGLTKQCSLNNSTHGNDRVAEFIEQHIYATTAAKMDFSASFSIIVGLLFPILQEPCRQILKRLPWTTDWKVDQVNNKLTRRLDEIVATRSNDHIERTQSKDFLTLVLNMRASEKGPNKIFTPDYISSLAYEHLLAGSATVSFTLSSILYLVAGHPEVERKLRKEIDGFGPQDRTPTADDLQHKFPYLDQVIKEAMRYHTMSPLIARETSTQVEIGGYVLPKGTWVWLAVGVMAKDAKHFPEPEKFKPERFDPNCYEENQRHPYANIPFGLGPRVCIGMKFALQEIRLAAIHLYQRFIFRHSPDMETPVALDYGIVREFKHGVKLRVTKRK